jgi:hypothetical protein
MKKPSVPQVAAVDLVLVARDLAVAAPKKGLPTLVKEALSAVASARANLENALRSPVDAPRRSGNAPRALVRELRGALGALRQMLTALAGLPEADRHGHEARAIVTKLFPREARTYSKARALQLAAESALIAAADKPTAQALSHLGATPLVHQLEAALKAAAGARALAALEPNASDDAATSTFGLMGQLSTALRGYAEVVMAADRMGLVEASALLAPLSNMAVTRRRPKAAPKPDANVGGPPGNVTQTPGATDVLEIDEGPHSRAA